eukprot:GFKZ01009831.1.p1 GENE.GFKZ01009831.1~~GFKZ01009831.1.p1  ORF type:complete len:192 (-),score=22.19 GFKZ01009831.1:652-1227(-)
MKRGTSVPRAPTRSTRKRKTSDRVQTLSPQDVALARRRHLDSLEDDNHAARHEAETLANEQEYDPELGSDDDAFGVRRGSKRRANTKKKRLRSAGAANGGRGKREGVKGIEKWNKSLAQALEEEGDEEMDGLMGRVRWAEIEGRESLKPRRKFCSVCGYQANYTCTQCLVRFCSVTCGNLHRETRCLKFIV